MPSVRAAAALAAQVLLGEVLSTTSQVSVPSQANLPWAWGRVSIKGVGPSVREGHAAVEVGERVYIFGGCVQETRCYNDVWILDTDRMDWFQERYTGSVPEPRGGHTAVLVGSDIYLYGGANSQDTFGDMYRLDLEQKHWSQWSNPDPELTPGRRTSHAAVAEADGRIYVFGGYDLRGKFLNDWWMLKVPPPSRDPWKPSDSFIARWVKPATTGKKPSARVGHSMTIIGRGCFVFGGFSANGEMLNDVHLYDLDELDWRELRPTGGVPPPRQAHAAVRHGRDLVISGGCDISVEKPVCFSDVWSLSPLDLRWVKRSNDTATWLPREGHSVTFVRGKMLAFGGCMLGSECYSDVTALNTFDPCPGRCGGNGECVDTAGGAFCRCTRSGYIGHDCMQPVLCREDCGPHGRCAASARCTCDNGWSGEDCSREAVCPGSDTKCNSRGLCLPTGACQCLPGFSGRDCGLSRAALFLQQDSAEQEAAQGGLRGELASIYSGLLSGLRPVREHAALPVGLARENASALAAAAGAGAADDFAEAILEGHMGRGRGRACSVVCLNHGVCQDGVCFCQPGFSGMACSTALAVEETGGVGLGQALTVAAVAAGASAVFTCLASRWGHSKQQRLFHFPDF